MFEYVQMLSIFLEVVIALVFVVAARKGRPYLYGLALTFAIYVWYDLVRLMEWEVMASVQNSLFLAATLAALYAAWRVYREVANR